MNLYRGYGHDCAYCDGRAEKYYVEGEFGRDVEVKVNAPELLEGELDAKRKRKPMRRGFVMLGGGGGDSYQPAEEKYGLTRRILEVLERHPFPVHVLTKSVLVERDLDILKRIHERNGAVVSMSFSSADDAVSAVFEPGCALPSKRFGLLRRFADEGIPTGMFYMPVIPFVTDKPEMIAETVRRGKEAGVRFAAFGGMTMKGGRQEAHFMKVLAGYRPGLEPEYNAIYRGNRWGQPIPDYHGALDPLFLAAARKHQLPMRMPAALFAGKVDENDLVTVILDQMDSLTRMRGNTPPFRSAVWTLSKLEEPVSSYLDPTVLKGIGPRAAKIIAEILDTGTCREYESLLF